MTTTGGLSLTHLHFDVDDDGIATALIDRAGESMNTLSPEMAADLAAIIEQVESDPAIRAVVIGSAKRDNFLAGADIRWLKTLDDRAKATEAVRAGQEGFDRLERLSAVHGKPVVAAIHGPALGGGLELALACSVRICSNDERRTQLGLPEVQIGVIPGGGGTQRLPRLVGIAAALDLILTGRPARPRRARKLGLVDEVVPVQSLMEVAGRRAREEAAKTGRGRANLLARVRELMSPAEMRDRAMEDTPLGRKLVFSRARQQLLERTKGNYPAPEAALEAVQAGIERGAAAGYAVEAQRFGELVVSPQAKALMSIFFATQELKRDPGVAGGVEARPVHKVAVLGGGLMGGGIAAVTALEAGVPVRIKEVDDAGVGRGLAYVRKNVDGRVERRRLTARAAARTMNLVTGTVDFSGFSSVDLVIEAVFEDLELKRSLLQQAEGLTRDDAIFASNTSSLPIKDIAAASKHPETVIGMHYFSPVERMPLLEVIVTDQTADWVTATCVEFGKRQGKTVIVVNDGTGFYTTRILGPYMNEVGWLLDEGAAIEEIDEAMVEWGFPVGPVVLMDEVGIDVGVKIAAIMQKAFGERLRAPGNMARLIDDDRMGRKNGRGFYRYEAGKKLGVDDTVYAVLGRTEQVAIPRPVIQERLVLAMVNEAALCLQEGILRSARDGDIGAVMGLGFPPFRGGPFMYVDQQGAGDVVARLETLAADYGDRFEPASILRDQAGAGERFRG